MIDLGFSPIPEETIARNGNQYFASGWGYGSVYQQHTVLRPHVRLEFTARTPYFPTTPQALGYLACQLVEKDESPVTMQCVAVEETLAEKVLSFLRRFAEHRSGPLTGGTKRWCATSTTPGASLQQIRPLWIERLTTLRTW